MGMVYSSKDDLKWNSRIKRAEALIEKGSKKLVQGLCQKSLLDKVAVLPLEVLSLIIMGLLQDQVGKSDDICDTYSQYMNSLVSSTKDALLPSRWLTILGQRDHVETLG